MSATAALRELVETVVGQITGTLRAKDTEQDKKLADLDKRVSALEDRLSPAAKKATTARPASAGAKADSSK